MPNNLAANKPDLTKNPRPVRSYVLRQGRMTIAQTRALDECWKTYGIDVQEASDECVADGNRFFSRPAPCVLEIGFGMGQSLCEQAKAQPDVNFLGIEVHKPGVGHLLWQLQKDHIQNVKIFNADAIEILKKYVPGNFLHKIQIFFPDPWPKKRHHKRRLIQPANIALMLQKLARGGFLHIATDWQDYAENIILTLDAFPELINQAPPETHPYVPRPSARPLTKFEARGQKLGHGVWDIVYQYLPAD